MNPLPWRPIWYEGVDGCVGDGVLIERLVVSHAPVLEPGVQISSVLFKNDFRINLVDSVSPTASSRHLALFLVWFGSPVPPQDLTRQVGRPHLQKKKREYNEKRKRSCIIFDYINLYKI